MALSPADVAKTLDAAVSVTTGAATDVVKLRLDVVVVPSAFVACSST